MCRHPAAWGTKHEGVAARANRTALRAILTARARRIRRDPRHFRAGCRPHELGGRVEQRGGRSALARRAYDRYRTEGESGVRLESSVVSWIPREAVRGIAALPFGVVAHYDPPPDVLEHLGGLRETDWFRCANELRAWIEVEDGRIVAWARKALLDGMLEVEVDGAPVATLGPGYDHGRAGAVRGRATGCETARTDSVPDLRAHSRPVQRA